MIAQLVRVVPVATDATAQGGDQVPTSREEIILSKRAFSTFRILPLRGQDGLDSSGLQPCFGGTTSRVPFHDVEFDRAGSFSRQSASLPGKTGDIQRAPGGSFHGPGRFAGTGRVDDLLLTTILASPGFSSRSPPASPIACSTAVFTSDETSLSLVWEENWDQAP